MNESTNKSKTVLGPDCRISGELSLDNDAVIMGQFKGTLRVTGMLELTESAEVSGTIIVGTLRLSGKVEADVVAEDGVELLPGAQLTGQLFTSQLHVVEGATFQGDVCIGPRAMEQASAALNGQDIDRPAPRSYTQPQQHENENEQQEDAGNVNTVPGSVHSILQRRRPKVMGARHTIGANANGNGNH